ncbi:unnamed protein product [Gordionus sp. m RMFG-2023]
MISAIITLIYFLLQAISRIYYLTAWNKKNIDYLHAGTTPDRIRGFNIGWGLELLFAIFVVISSIFLIMGIRRNNRSYFVPWMVSLMLMIIIVLCSSIATLALGHGVVSFLASAIVNIIVALFLVYCLLCVVSYYQELGG